MENKGKRPGRKRLSMDVPEGFHKELETEAKKRNSTITRLVMRAIVEYLKKLQTYK